MEIEGFLDAYSKIVHSAVRCIKVAILISPLVIPPDLAREAWFYNRALTASAQDLYTDLVPKNMGPVCRPRQ